VSALRAVTAVPEAAMVLALPPLLLSVIAKTKAWFGGRVGPPWLQPYYDLHKLMRKGAVYSKTTTWVFRAGPIVNLDILYQTGAEAWRDLVRLAWARSRARLDDRAWSNLLRLADRWAIPQLPVGGHDLITAGVAPGPEIGRVLRRLEDWWMASDFKPDRAELLKRV